MEQSSGQLRMLKAAVIGAAVLSQQPITFDTGALNEAPNDADECAAYATTNR